MIQPYFFQYAVQPSAQNPACGNCSGAIATVIVFAENGEQGQARASRWVSRNGWQICEVKRAMEITTVQVVHLDGELQRLYSKAEQRGIAALIDRW